MMIYNDHLLTNVCCAMNCSRIAISLRKDEVPKVFSNHITKRLRNQFQRSQRLTKTEPQSTELNTVRVGSTIPYRKVQPGVHTF